MSFKIEFYYREKKRKHKLYDTEKSFWRRWKYHKDFCSSVNAEGARYGLVSRIDGKICETHGSVPDNLV